jgi:hypothetical protein
LSPARLEWAVDSDFHFFLPTVPVHLAVNKAMAAARRCAVRDLFELVPCMRQSFRLGQSCGQRWISRRAGAAGPDRLENFSTHAGQRRSQWPSSPETAAAMLERNQASEQ